MFDHSRDVLAQLAITMCLAVIVASAMLVFGHRLGAPLAFLFLLIAAGFPPYLRQNNPKYKVHLSTSLRAYLLAFIVVILPELIRLIK